MKTIEVIYEGGIFRPAEPVDLPEHTRLLLDVPDSNGQADANGNGHNDPDPLAKYRGKGSWPESDKPSVDINEFIGSCPDILGGEDPVEWQRRIRAEWDREGFD